MFFQVSLETIIAPENPWMACFQGGYKAQKVALHFCFPTNRSIRIMIIDSSPSSGQKEVNHKLFHKMVLEPIRYKWSDMRPTINGIQMGFTGV